jgi:hypothetical protein
MSPHSVDLARLDPSTMHAGLLEAAEYTKIADVEGLPVGRHVELLSLHRASAPPSQRAGPCYAVGYARSGVASAR